jgi:hypothetical protein
MTAREPTLEPVRKRIAATIVVVLLVLTAGLGWAAASRPRLGPVQFELPWDGIEPITSNCWGDLIQHPNGDLGCVGGLRGGGPIPPLPRVAPAKP